MIGCSSRQGPLGERWDIGLLVKGSDKMPENYEVLGDLDEDRYETLRAADSQHNAFAVDAAGEVDAAGDAEGVDVGHAEEEGAGEACVGWAWALAAELHAPGDGNKHLQQEVDSHFDVVVLAVVTVAFDRLLARALSETCRARLEQAENSSSETGQEAELHQICGQMQPLETHSLDSGHSLCHLADCNQPSGRSSGITYRRGRKILCARAYAKASPKQWTTDRFGPEWK